MKKTLIFCIFLTMASVAGIWIYAFTNTYKPHPVEAAHIQCLPDTPNLPENRPLKVMSYNVQYMAGRDYVFYYDLPGMEGPDKRPSASSIDESLMRIANIIKRESPDVLLLQEMHNGHSATDHRNLLAELQQRLKKLYPCTARTDYWRSSLVLHPKIMGAVGMELVTLSKYQIQEATRFQLPQTPKPWFSGPFHIQRAILETDIRTEVGRLVKIMNTHLEAFPNDSDVKAKEVDFSLRLLRGYEAAGIPWIFGGDLNLVPQEQLDLLNTEERYLYSYPSELTSLLEKFPSIPSKSALSKGESPKWLTYSPNRYEDIAPDRTLDYVFYAPDWRKVEGYVLSDTEAHLASDHMPVVAVLEFVPFVAN